MLFIHTICSSVPICTQSYFLGHRWLIVSLRAVWCCQVGSSWAMLIGPCLPKVLKLTFPSSFCSLSPAPAGWLKAHATFYRYGTQALCLSAQNTRQSLFCSQQRLCRVWHSANSTRQKKWWRNYFCWMSFLGYSAKFCRVSNRSRQSKAKTLAKPLLTDALSSARRKTLGKVGVFAECQKSGTWQSLCVCRMLWLLHSTKLGTLPSAFTLALGKVLSQEPVNGDFAKCQSKCTR